MGNYYYNSYHIVINRIVFQEEEESLILSNMRCPNCYETDHEPNAKFCHNCGFKLGGTSVVNKKTTASFSFAESFSEGLAMVGIGGKAGFVDKSGNIVIEPRFNPTSSYSFGYNIRNGFSEGLAVVSVGKYPKIQYGCIDTSGQFVIQPKFDLILPFSEGLAAFQHGGKWGFLDKTGKIVVPAQKYESVSSFSEGLASARLGWRNYVIIDKTGRTVFDKTRNAITNWSEGFIFRRTEFEFAGGFCEGLARVTCAGKLGYIDKTGKFKRTDFNSIHDFSEGLAVFSTDNYKKCGYLDANLEMAISPIFGGADDFHENLAAVWMSKNSGYGYVDKKGRMAIPCQFNKAAPFSEGLAPVELNGKFGYIDKAGNIVIDTRFDAARCFSEGLAAVKKKDRWGFIDRSGNYVF